MSRLLEDLSLLLELSLVTPERDRSRERVDDDLEQLAEKLIDRLTRKIEAATGLLFVRRDPISADGEARFGAHPTQRARHLIDPARLAVADSDIEALLSTGQPMIRPGTESVAARAARPEVRLPGSVLSVPIRDQALLEIYADPSALDPRIARVVGSLAGWLELQIDRIRSQSALRSRAEELESSCAEIDRLVESLPGVVWRSNQSGALIFVGKRSQEMLGLAPAALLSPESAAGSARDPRAARTVEGPGRSAGDSSSVRAAGMRPADRERIADELTQAIAARRPETILSYRFFRGGKPGGEPIEIEEHVQLTFDRDGELIEQAGIMFDVTVSRAAIRRIEELSAHRTAAARADALRLDAARTSRAKTEFLNLLSHELRAPLFPIIALSDLLLRIDEADLRHGDWRDQLRMINVAGKQMLQLVSDLLDISRVDAGRFRPNPGPIDLEHFAHGIKERNEERAKSRGSSIELTVNGGPRGPHLYTDRSTLDRVANVLVSHALESLGSTKVALELAAEAAIVRLTLRALGPGVPKVDSEQIFEPFWERDANTKHDTRGHGLALALVRRLVLTLGGSAAAWSENDTHVVEVELPCAYPGDRLNLLKTPRVTVGSAELGSIFDLALAVQAMGAEVRLAASAGEVVELVKQRAMDVLMVDVRMPGLRVLEDFLVVERANGGKLPRVIGLSRPGDPLTLTGALADEAMPLPPSRARLERMLTQ